MSTITKQHKLNDMGFAFSIGPAVDLGELDKAMREFAQQPWEVNGGEAEDCGEKAILAQGE